jgi:uncharacterized membrane protein HdeD (DUF308 family)
MSTATSFEKSAVNGFRTALGIGGALAVIAGILILVWPVKTAMVFTAILAIYAVAAGLVYVGLGIFSARKGGWARVGHIVLGIVFVAAGIVAFANLQSTTAWIAVFAAVFIGVAWIVEGIVSLTTLPEGGSRVWTVVFAIISLIAGIYLIMSPFLGALALWWVLGISAIALGIAQLVRAFTFGK